MTTTASLEYYTEIVRKKAILRALIEVGGRIVELGYDERQDTDEILDKAESLIFDISRRDSTGDYYLISQYLYEHIDKLRNCTAIRTGIRLPGCPLAFAGSMR